MLPDLKTEKNQDIFTEILMTKATSILIDQSERDESISRYAIIFPSKIK